MVWNRRNSLSLSLSAVPSDHLGFQNSQTIRLKSGAKAASCGNDKPQGFPRKGRFAKHLSSAIGLIGCKLSSYHMRIFCCTTLWPDLS